MIKGGDSAIRKNYFLNEIFFSSQSKSAPSFDELQKGQFCAGIYSGDNSWTRAEILQVKESPVSTTDSFILREVE